MKINIAMRSFTPAAWRWKKIHASQPQPFVSVHAAQGPGNNSVTHTGVLENGLSGHPENSQSQITCESVIPDLGVLFYDNISLQQPRPI